MTPETNATSGKRAKAAKLRKTTAILLAVFTVVLLVWDIDVAHNDVKNDTISELLRDISHNFWTLPFVLMGIMGHLFWNRQGKVRKLRFVVVTLPTWHYANLIVGTLGFLGGALWWPQLGPSDPSTDSPDPSQDIEPDGDIT
jgi:cytochrome bd-type quinol oxidase subunit 2